MHISFLNIERLLNSIIRKNVSCDACLLFFCKTFMNMCEVFWGRKGRGVRKKPKITLCATCWYLDTLFHFNIIQRLIATCAYMILSNTCLFLGFSMNCVFSTESWTVLSSAPYNSYNLFPAIFSALVFLYQNYFHGQPHSCAAPSISGPLCNSL